MYTLAYSAGGEQFQTRLIHNLQSAARATVTGATQLVNISQAATKYSRGNSYQVSSSRLSNDIFYIDYPSPNFCFT